MKKSKIVAGVLTLLFVLISVCFMQPKGSEVMANDNSNAFHVEESLDISDYKIQSEDGTITSVLPKATGEYADWIFAGWYKDVECTTTVGKNIVQGTYHAKFVPAEVLSIKCQTNADITSKDETAKIRVVSTVDSLKYSQVGFDLQFKGKEISYQTSTVLSGIEAAKDGVEYGFSPNIFDLQSKYFITATIVNIANADFDEGILMKPYWVTKDGTKVYGIERYARVEDSYLHIVNVPIRLVSDNVTAKAGTVTVTYDNENLQFAPTYTGTIKDDVQTITPGFVAGGAFSVEAAAGTEGTVTVTGSADTMQSTDGMFAHLRFKALDANGVLPKTNIFEVAATSFTDADKATVTGVAAVDSVYKYYNTAKTSQSDKDWFNGEHVKPGTTEFVITSPDELYGLAELVNGGYITTEKIYLGTDITVNTGTIVSKAEDGTITINKTYDWTPIGSQASGKKFAGTFDGQGHTISGLHTNASTAASNKMYVGLFGFINTTGTVKNFRITNSYFKASDYAASVAGCLESGTIENVYSEAYVETSATAAGGVVGISNGTGVSSIEKCWFKGTVTAKSLICGGIVGVANGKNNTKNIINCLNEGDVIGTQWVGGLVGRVVDSETVITNSLNMGNVSGTSVVGSIVGKRESTCTTNNVYALTADKTYAIGSDSANKEVTTFTNANKNSYYGYKALDVLRDKWDFENTWVVRENNTPVLKTWCESGALYTPATTWAGGTGVENDPYIIKTASQLYKLANDVNNGTTYDNTFFKLGANITVNSGTASKWADSAPKYNWITIGKQGNKHFKGSFDGAYYTIKGLYIVDTSTAVGLFVDPDEVVLENLKVTNSYLKGGTGTAAVVGWYGGGTFDSIYSDAIVVSTGAHGAGLVSLVDQAKTTLTNCWFDGSLTTGDFSGGIVSCNTQNITLTNCLNTGNIATTGTQVAGMVGRVGASVVMSDCLNTGAVTTGGNRASIVGYINAGTVEVERVYALTSSNTLTNGNINTGAALKGTIDKVEDVTGGNGYLNTYLPFDRPELPIPTTGEWVARKNNVPALKSLVSASDILPLDGNNMYRADKRWLNEAGSETIGDVTYATYTIDTAEEFVGFSNHVTAGNDFLNSIVYLGKDIALNKGTVDEWEANNFAGLYTWSPIGTQASGKKFAGIFDGQGHTISGVYTNELDGSGLFGQIADGSKVTDFSLVNSCIVGRQGVGAICGWYGGGTFDTIYTNAKIIGNFGATSNSGHYGGFVGLVNANTKFKNCWFDGEMAIAGQYVGGIAGTIPNTGVQMTDCLNTGKMSCTFTGTDYQLGGLAGRVTQALTITDCLVACDEKIDVKSTAKNVGSVLGYVGAAGTNTNVYVLENVYGNVTIGAGTTVAPTVSADLNGQNGYLNTYLTFDRPELPIPTTGAWVVRKDNVPGLKSFVSESDILELEGSNMYRADKRWLNEADSETIGDVTYTTYTIDTAEEFVGFSNHVTAGNDFLNSIVYLGKDIALNKGTVDEWEANNFAGLYTWSPIGTQASGEKFAGIFDGQGYTISGIYTNELNGSGLFGQIADGSKVTDFSLVNSCIVGRQGVGAICGWYGGGTFDTIYTNAKIIGNFGATSNSGHYGGFVGLVNANTKFQKCWFDGEMAIAGQYVGGIAGTIPNTGVQMTDCLNTGKMSCTFTGTDYQVGGLAGRVTQVLTITNSLVACDEKIDVKATAEKVGSVLGYVGAAGTNTNVYALEKVYGNKAIGDGTTAAPTICSDLNNYKGYMNTNLDFDNTWVAMENSAPVLQNFAPEEGKFDTTSWYVKAGDGVGTSEENPYLLDSVADMYGFAKRANASTDGFAGKYFKLTSSVSFNEGNPTDGNWATTAPYYVWTPIGSATANFKGHFDGGSHTISGLYVKNAASANDKKLWYVGLFGYVDGAEIKNVSVKDSYFYASYYAASIVGWLQNGTLSNVYSNSTIQVASGHGGGIAGALSNATIQNAWFEGSVTGGSFVGGIVGFINDQSGRVSSCLSDGTIAGSQSGGIIGRVAGQTTIDNCLSVSNVTGGNAGALVGYHYDCELTINSSFGLKSGAQVTVNTSNEANGSPTGNATDTSVKANSLITNREHLYDTGAYGFQQEQFDENQELTGNKWVSRLDYTKWTARIGDIPVPAVFEVADGYQVDTSWYDVEEAGTMENPYLIKDVADFYGFAILSQTKDFTGKVISLENNLIINKDANAQTAKLYEWIPIGDRETPFAGTFLGNGYTITGLYKTFKAWERLAWIGMFEMTADTSVISNFNIKNTYFAYTGTSNSTRIGSVAGEGYGTFDSIYSDTTLKSGGVGVGGILGVVCNADSRANITNCWYAGEIISTRSEDCYLGGIVGFLYNGSEVVVSHSLYSGSITTDGTRVGGICGNVENGKLTSTDNLITGKLSGKEHVGIVVGRAKTIPEGSATLHINTTWGVNDYAAYDVGSTETPIISGKAHISTSKDRFIGMIPEYNSITGVEETLASQKAEGEETGFDGWVMIKDGTPVLKSFVKEGVIKTDADVYDYECVVSALNPNGDYASWFANTPEHKGDGTYQYVIEQQTNARYTAYCNALSSGAFELYSSNTVEGDGVSNHIFTAKNDDLVVNVTFVPTNTIYITVSTGQPLSEYLKGVAVNADEQNVATDAYTLVGDEQLENVTFHMLEQTADMNGVANSFVIRKKNGHFILIDGGVDLQAPYLFEYLESLVLEDGKKPVIDAWVISHGHYDHFGVFKTIWNDSFATGDAKKNYAGQVYVNGIYFNEPNSALWTQYNSNDLQFLGYMKRAVPLFKTSTGNTPSIYRMQTGQGYTFGDVTMDVMLSQELLTAEDYSWANTKTGGAFNETSTWTMFTINNKKVLTAGDGEEKSKDRIVEMYSKNYMNVDVFTALHHGINMNTIVTTVLGNVVNWNDDFTDHINVNSVVLYSRRNDIMEDTAPEDKNNRAKKNKAFLDEMTDLGVVTKYADGTTSTSGNHPKYFYYGQGTSVLTFGDTITAELKTRISE